MRLSRLGASASLFALLMGSAGAVYAQETTSAIHGVVTDGAQPAANQAVTVLHVPSGTRLNTATNAAGVFDARGLRVGGPYTVTVGGKSYDNLYIELGKTFDFTADLGAQEEIAAVEVVATATRDSEQGPKTVLNRDAISSVVSVNRDIRDLARRDILVSQDLRGRGGTNEGGISIAGSNPRFNRITVDGVSANDAFGLAQGGLTTARGPVTLDAVEQFVVAAVPTDVENGDFTGGAMNLVLRSGTNSFHGAAFINYLNDGLVGAHVGDLKVHAPVSQQNWGGFLSGPLWKDKLFFAVSYETYKTSDTTGFGVIGQGLPNAVTAFPQSLFDRLVGIYNNGYRSKFDIGTVAATQPVTDKKYSAKVDWNITDRHRASFTYRYAKSTSIQRTDSGQTTLTPTSHWYQQLNKDEAYTFELNSKWTDRLSTNFKATKRSYLNGQNPPSGQNYADVQVCTAETSDANLTSCAAGSSSLRFGPDQFRHANQLSEKELRFNFQAEYTLGENLLKLGMQARQAKPFDLFVSQSHGVYYFDSITDFQNGTASRLQYQNAVTGNPLDAAFNTTYWTYSGYFQDALNITDDLKVTAGFRYDWYDYPDSPILNPNFLTRNGYANTATIDKKSILQPRVSVEWKATDRLKINGGFGLFSGGTPDVLTGTPFYNTGYATTNIDIQRTAAGTYNETTGAGGFSQAIGAQALAGLNADPNFGYQIPSQVQALQRGTITGTPLIPTGAEAFALDPTFKLPGQWKAFASARWDFKGFDLGLDAVVSKASNEIAFYDSRATPLVVNGVAQMLPDGRIRYDGLPNGTTPGKTSNNAGSNRDLIITNVKNGGRSWTVGATVGKSWDWGGDFMFGYSRSHATDTGPGLRFGTTAGSLYASVPRFGDPNSPAYVGRSVDEIKNRFKMQIGYRREFIKENETRITLFGERQSGRPFGFFMSDSASGRSPVFGVNQTAQALYVPDMSQLSGLNAGIVTFATQADADLFKGYVDKFHLKPGLLKKYSNTNQSINRLDLQISQQLPSIIKGHHFRVVADMRNLLNFIDHDWGVAKEYSDVTTLARVQCATAAGAAVAATDSSCARYRYSLVPTTVTPAINNGLSLWYAQISFRYEF